MPGFCLSFQNGSCHKLRSFFVFLLISSALFLVVNDSAYAQDCDLEFSLGDDITIDCGAETTFTAPPGYTYLWSTGATTQSIDVSQAGTYWVRIVDAQNSLVNNGEFSAGDTGFDTEYTPATGGPYGLLSTHDQYALAANANDVHDNFVNCFDHTTGDASGNMLLANGSEVANKILWSQTVTVAPNTEYAFSAWGMSAVASSPARLQLLVNGNQVGEIYELPNVTCQWEQAISTWYSGTNTTANLAIVDDNIVNSGNDFAIDDVFFSPTCIYTDTVEVSVPDAPSLTVTTDTTICAGESITLTANSSIPGSTYLWQPGGLEGESVTVTPNSTVIYTAIATSPQNCNSSPQSVLITVTQPEEYNLELPETYSTCAGTPVTLDFDPATEGTYTWEPANLLDDANSANPVATVDQDTDFTVVYTNICGQTQEATTTVTVGGSEIDLGPDLQLCAGSEYTITLPPGPDYVWQDGSTGNEYTVNTTGTYAVESSDGDCVSTGSIVIEFLDNPELVAIDDAEICEGESYDVDLPTGQYTYLWDDGSTDASRTFTTTGTYTVTAALGDCEGTTSFDLTVNPLPEIALEAPGAICEGSSAVLSVDFEDGAVTWSTGEESPEITVSEAGTYSATVTQNNCSSTESVNLNIFPTPAISISGSAELCDGEEGMLTATSGDYSYVWNNDSTQNPLKIFEGGTYSVAATDLSTGCVGVASTHVSKLPEPGVSLREELELCMGKSKQIIAMPVNKSDLVWSDGTSGRALDVSEPGTYQVTASTVCGSVTKSVVVIGMDCTETLYIPNSFSPDGDGLNDIFKAVGTRVTKFQMKIFDRWGKEVFSTEDINQGWNGDSEGSGYYVPNGAYSWIVKVEYESGFAETRRGSIQVIR